MRTLYESLFDIDDNEKNLDKTVRQIQRRLKKEHETLLENISKLKNWKISKYSKLNIVKEHTIYVNAPNLIKNVFPDLKEDPPYKYIDFSIREYKWDDSIGGSRYAYKVTMGFKPRVVILQGEEIDTLNNQISALDVLKKYILPIFKDLDLLKNIELRYE